MIRKKFKKVHEKNINQLNKNYFLEKSLQLKGKLENPCSKNDQNYTEIQM